MLVVVALAGVAIAGAFALTESGPAGTQRKPAKAPAAIHKIKHVIVIMQENRSFDHYFGTYPGADGFPRTPDGDFAVCVPDPAKGVCQKPYHDTNDLNAGGPLLRQREHPRDRDTDGRDDDGHPAHGSRCRRCVLASR